MLKASAETAVREMLKEIAVNTKGATGTTHLSAADFMDDGSVIQLDIDIDENTVSFSVCRFSTSAIIILTTIHAFSPRL